MMIEIETARGKATINTPEGINPVVHFDHGIGCYVLQLKKIPIWHLDADAEDWREKSKELETHVSSKALIKAIKTLRDMFPWLDLRQAKEAVEGMM